jgi:5'-phosphate synthase pdxT subunit
MKIGVLALQGDFREHLAMVSQLGVDNIAVRSAGELKGLNGLIIPGGESTTALILMHNFGLIEPIRKLAKNGMPIMGTCAGMIHLAKEVLSPNMETLGLMDITVRRNGFGRQIDSFEIDIPITILPGGSFHAIFIRAPVIERVGPAVEVLARLPDDKAIAVKEENLVALAFHPELTLDTRLHEYFLAMASSAKIIENKP